MSQTPDTATPADVPSAPQPPETAPEPSDKMVPVGEAIRYRKRAQAAEQELEQLKQTHQQQADELAALKAQTETLQAAVDEAAAAPPARTQGVKETRTTGARTRLQAAARQAADSGSRTDVQQYLRLRRDFV